MSSCYKCILESSQSFKRWHHFPSLADRSRCWSPGWGMSDCQGRRGRRRWIHAVNWWPPQAAPYVREQSRGRDIRHMVGEKTVHPYVTEWHNPTYEHMHACYRWIIFFTEAVHFCKYGHKMADDQLTKEPHVFIRSFSIQKYSIFGMFSNPLIIALIDQLLLVINDQRVIIGRIVFNVCGLY